jgi:hypothetical protein
MGNANYETVAKDLKVSQSAAVVWRLGMGDHFVGEGPGRTGDFVGR